MGMRAKNIQPAKAAEIKMLEQKIKDNKDFIFAEYRGLTVEQISALRKQLGDRQAEFHVVKNNLARIAFEKSSMPSGLTAVLAGPMAIAYSKKDSNEVAKVLLDFAKDAPALKVKAGLVDGNLITPSQVEAFSALPSRLVLISMLMSVMQGPAQNMVYLLKAIPQSLVCALKALEEQKSKN